MTGYCIKKSEFDLDVENSKGCLKNEMNRGIVLEFFCSIERRKF